MDVVDDVCESEGVCEVMCDGLSHQPEQEESMETHWSEEEAARMAKSASTEEHADLNAAAPSTESSSSDPLEPRYSYRLVFNKSAKHWMSQAAFGCNKGGLNSAIFKMF